MKQIVIFISILFFSCSQENHNDDKQSVWKAEEYSPNIEYSHELKILVYYSYFFSDLYEALDAGSLKSSSESYPVVEKFNHYQLVQAINELKPIEISNERTYDPRVLIELSLGNKLHSVEIYKSRDVIKVDERFYKFSEKLLSNALIGIINCTR